MDTSTSVEGAKLSVRRKIDMQKPSVHHLPSHPIPTSVNGTCTVNWETTASGLQDVLPSSIRKLGVPAIVVLRKPVPLWFIARLKEKRILPYIDRLSTDPKRLESAISAVISKPEAVWELATIAIRSYTCATIHTITYGRVAHVDLVWKDQISFKLTQATMDTLWHSLQTVDADDSAKTGDKVAFYAHLEAHTALVSARALTALQMNGTGLLHPIYARQVKRQMIKALHEAMIKANLALKQ